MEEERGLSTLPIWTRGEGSLLFQYGRGERALYSSNMEEGRWLSTLPYLLSTLPIWKMREGSSNMEEERGIALLPYWERGEELCSLLPPSSNMEDERERERERDSEKVKNKCYCYWDF